jgi:hypothetical protein
VARRHEVRSAAKTGALRALAAESVIVDALDPDSVADVVAKAEPEVIVHELTALSGPVNFQQMKRMAATTNRLRTEGTDDLLAARGWCPQVARMQRTGGPVSTSAQAGRQWLMHSFGTPLPRRSAVSSLVMSGDHLRCASATSAICSIMVSVRSMTKTRRVRSW